jgi:hypothetical protein
MPVFWTAAMVGYGEDLDYAAHFLIKYRMWKTSQLDSANVWLSRNGMDARVFANSSDGGLNFINIRRSKPSSPGFIERDAFEILRFGFGMKLVSHRNSARAFSAVASDGMG